jgi:hypothetical protein
MLKCFFVFKGEIITLNNDSYYLFFLNMSQVNGFKGFVGYGIRELNESEKIHFV